LRSARPAPRDTAICAVLGEAVVESSPFGMCKPDSDEMNTIRPSCAGASRTCRRATAGIPDITFVFEKTWFPVPRPRSERSPSARKMPALFTRMSTIGNGAARAAWRSPCALATSGRNGLVCSPGRQFGPRSACHRRLHGLPRARPLTNTRARRRPARPARKSPVRFPALEPGQPGRSFPVQDRFHRFHAFYRVYRVTRTQSYPIPA